MIRFTLPYPRSIGRYGLNAYYEGKHWAERKKDAEYWHWLVHSELRRQNIKKRMFTKPVQITFLWDDRLDIDNHAVIGKMIVDALKGTLINDDNRKHFRRVAHDFHSGRCIEVEIREVGT